MLINLKVDFKDKDKAKRLGARWDYERKTWFIHNVEDLTPFMKWIDKDYNPQVQHSTNTHKVNEKFWARTGPKVFTPMCDCDALPWDDCEHTEFDSIKAMQEMLMSPLPQVKIPA
jgi:hypothetical protein